MAGFIVAQRAEHGIPYATACRALGVSRSWFNKWRHGDASRRRARRAQLVVEIRRLYAARRGRYGAPRVTGDLRDAGWRASENTVAQIMRDEGLVGRPTRRRRGLTRPGRGRWRAPDLVGRDFGAEVINTKWYGDGTEIPTDEGKLYLATVLDVASRRIPGFALGEHHDARLAYQALAMAVAIRGGRDAIVGVIMHTDQGSEEELKWSSQHLDDGGANDGDDEGATGGGPRVPRADAVAWSSDGGVAAGPVAFWAVIAQGDKTDDAAAAAGVSSPVGYRWFRHAGGVNPCLAPTVSGRYLSFSEREDIALYRAQGHGVREIARRIGRSPSTVSRELRRNASTRTFRLEYKATIAQWHAERRARRPKPAKLVGNDRLRTYVQDRLSGRVKTAGGRVLGPEGPE